MSAAPAIKSRLKFRLKIISGPHQNEIHTLDRDVVKIGRGDDNTIQLPRDGRISRNHVEIFWNGFDFKIRNLSQKNFVMVNEKVIQEETLKPGMRVQIGETLIEIFEDGPILVPKSEATVANAPMPSPLVQTSPPAVQPRTPPPSSSTRPPPPSTSAYANVPPIPSQAYQSRPSAQPRRSSAPRFRPQQSGSRMRLYMIVAAIIGGLLWVASQDNKPKEKPTFRTSMQVEYDRLQAEAEKVKLEERIAAQNNQLVRQSQENMVKGFRDYQQGNFMRAKENFASVLIKDPDNELAKRYYHLSSIKFDELLQFYIMQGLRYREKKNYRLCRSSFQEALVMIQNNNKHPKYGEIKDYFDECNLALEGRF